MELRILKEYENKLVRITLKNNFSYTHIRFIINKNNLVEFEDKKGDMLQVEPSFVVMISKLNGGDEDGN